jgi:hypothetical protein
MKTPEQMAEEYAKEHHMGGWEYEASIPAWLAGYQAAKDEIRPQFYEIAELRSQVIFLQTKLLLAEITNER